jgi:hypothetical protein
MPTVAAQPALRLHPDAPVRRVLAVLFAVACVACPVIEPEPNGPQPDPPLWMLPVDLASLALIVAACVAVWRGSRRARLLGVLAGVGMAVETVLCPGTGHHLIGWYTWVQAGLSLFVLLSSAALPGVLAGITRLTTRSAAWRPPLPDWYAGVGQAGLDLTDAQGAEVEDAGREHGIGAGLHGGREVLDGAGSPAGDHRDAHLAAHLPDQLEVETGPGAIGVHRVEQHLAGAELGGADHPLDGVLPGASTSAVGGDLEAAPGDRAVADPAGV